MNLLFGRVLFGLSSAAMFIPSRLRGATESLAALLRCHITPSGGAEADSLPLYWRRRQFSTRHVENFQREIEQNLWRKPTLSHDASQRDRAPNAQALGEICWNFSG